MNQKYLDYLWWYEAVMPRLRTLRHRIGFRPHVLDTVIEGVACKIFIADPTAAAWYSGGHGGVSPEMRFVRDSVLHAGAKVFEIGGHHGCTAVILARSVGPQGRVVVCEPVPGNVAIIREQIRLNGLDNVVVVPEAIGAQSGHVTVRDISNGAVSTAGDGVGVPLTTIDALVERTGIMPDLIKIDVEGYEIDVLRGAARTLQRHPALQVEVHPHHIRQFGHRVEALWELVDLAAYRIWFQARDADTPAEIGGPVTIRHRSHVYLVPRAARGIAARRSAA